MIKKKRIILGVTISLSLISVATIGFSTWVTGLLQTEDEVSGIGVKVDVVEDQTAYLSISVSNTETINIVETTTTDTEADGIKFVENDDLENDFDIDFTTFQVVLPATEPFATYNQVSFTVNLVKGESSTELPKYIYNSDENSSLGRIKGTSYTYIEPVTTTFDLTDTELFTTDSTSAPGYNIYKLAEGKQKFSFQWGNLFKSTTNSTPVTFYQEKIDAVDDGEGTEDEKLIKKLAIMHEANVELDSMHTAFYSEQTPNTIKITAGLTKKQTN